MDVRLPNGRIIKNVPDDITRQELDAKLKANDISFDVPPPVEEEEEEYDTSIARKYLADPALSIAKGVTQLPDVVSGLADTFVLSPINAATKALGAPSEIQDLSVGKLFENIEEQLPDALQDVGETLEQAKSPELRAKKEAQRKEIDAAKGFSDTAKTTIGTMLENPSLLFDTLFESLPSTVTGGVVGKTLLKADKLRKAGLGTVGAGAVGEGLVSGGSTAESIRQQTEDGILSGKQAAIAGTSGLLTSIFGQFGGRLSKRFDALDIDTYLAGGVPSQKAQSKIIKGFKSAIIEGTAEELPQSMQEQMAQNIALGKDPMEGVAEAGASGFLLGMTMGGGASLLLENSNIDQTTPPQDDPKNKPDYTEDESMNEGIEFETAPEPDPQTADIFEDDENVQAIDKDLMSVVNTVSKQSYKTQEKAEARYKKLLENVDFAKVANQFKIVERINSKGETEFRILKDDLGGGGSGDEEVLTLEQEKAAYEQSQKFTGPRPEGFDSAGNRVGDVVSGALDFTDTDTQRIKKTEGDGVGRTSSTLRRPDARKDNVKNTLDFINNTDSKSSLRNPAIKKVLTDNPKILETATTDETTIGDTELTPNQYKNEYTKWENKQKQNKELWKKRKGNKKQLIKDFETSIKPSVNNQMAESLKPLQQERKVLDVAIREVVAEEYSTSSTTKRSNKLKKYRKPKEAKLEKEYQRINKQYKKDNNTKENISPAEAARIANNKQLKERTVSDKEKVTYFSDNRPQEFIEDKTIIEDINRKSFGLPKFRNFKTALKKEGLLDQYNKEVDNIIANPPGTQGNLPTEPGQAVPKKYTFETVEARDEFVQTAKENIGKKEREPVIDNKGKSNTDFEVTENEDIVATDLPGNARFKYTARIIPKPPISERERQQQQRKKLLKKVNQDIKNNIVKDPTRSNGEDLAQQELNTQMSKIQKVLEETIGKDGASIQEVLDVLRNYEGMQATFESQKIAQLFTNLIEKITGREKKDTIPTPQQKITATIFDGIKIKLDSKIKNRGQYNPKTQTISINLKLINQNQIQEAGPVVIHEIVHAMLDRVLLENNFNSLNTSMQEAVTEINRQYKLFETLKSKQPNSVFKRASSLKEFVAMMFESSELAKAIAEAAAQQQIETETELSIQGLGKQDRTEEEFENYINSITGTRALAIRGEENIATSIKNYLLRTFTDFMQALGLRTGANRTVQDVIQSSLEIILNEDYGKIYGGLKPGSISNFGNKDTKDANQLAEKEIQNELDNEPKEKGFYKNRTWNEFFSELIQKLQDGNIKIRKAMQKLDEGGILPQDENIDTQQTLINGKASAIFKEMIEGFINNMYLSYENFKSVMGLKERATQKMVDMYYEAMGEYDRARWLFVINMPVRTDNTINIPKWKDLNGVIKPWTGSSSELRKAILDRLSAATEQQSIDQSATDEIAKLREFLDKLITSEQKLALSKFKKGTPYIVGVAGEGKIGGRATKDAFDPMSIQYSSGTLGVNNKDTKKNIPSQVAARNILTKLGLNYDATLSPMTEQQLQENKNVVLDKAKRDAFLQLAERIRAANNGIKEVNKGNGFVPPQASNIIDFMGFKYYKSLKRKNPKDKNFHKVQDSNFLEKDLPSRDTNPGVEDRFSGGQQSSVNNVIAQTSADGSIAAMRHGIRFYTDAISKLSQATINIEVDDKKTIKKKTVAQPKVDFLKFDKTFTFDERYKIAQDKKLQSELKAGNIVLNFKLDGTVDVIKITNPEMMIAIKGVQDDISNVLKHLAKATALFGQVHTRFSIPFALTNFQRDFFTNIPLLIIKNPSAVIPYISEILGQVFKGNFITTWKYVRAMNRGDIALVRRGLKTPEGKYENTLARYLLSGGMISYLRGVSSASDAEFLTRDVMSKQGVLNTTFLTRIFDAWINTFELAVRGSANQALRPVVLKKYLNQAGNPAPGTTEYNNIKEGLDDTVSAIVKNLANFEQAGTDSAKYGAYFMFFKPSMTSAVVNVRAIAPAFNSENAYLNSLDPKLLLNPEYKQKALETFKGERLRAYAVIFGGGGLGYALWTVLASLGDEEEQKKFKQDSMDRWTRNIRIPLNWLPETAQDTLGIKKDTGDTMLQLHWGFGNMGWPAMGVQIASFVDSKYGGPNNPRVPTDFDIYDLFSNINNIAMDNFLPLPVSRSKLTDDPVFYFLDSIAPSIARPFVQYTANTNTFGYQITRQRATTVGGSYGGSMNTDELYRFIAEFVNQNSRFNEEGSWNMDPAVLAFAANSYIDGFARIVTTLAGSGEITDLESAKNKTLVFKQFFTKRVPIERDRYSNITKKIKNISATYEDFKRDSRYVDSKGRTLSDFEYENAANLQSVNDLKVTEAELKRLYKIQKSYKLGFRDDGTRMSEEERLEEIENIKIQIMAVMRQFTNQVEINNME